MMASPAKHEYLAILIRRVVDNIENHRYGRNWLDVTGPTAVCKAFASLPPEQTAAALTCEIAKVGLKALVVRETQNGTFPIAAKDEELHDVKGKNHYGKMWRKHEVFCDQLKKTRTGCIGH